MFTVCVPQPPGYLHSGCLTELAELICHGLHDLGHQARLSDTPAGKTIIIGGQLIHDGIDVPDDAILVNTEPLQSDAHWNPRILDWCRRLKVWDYAWPNIVVLARQGVRAQLLRIGHHPALTRIQPAPEQDVDVLFYGSNSERRDAVFAALRDTGLNFVQLFGVYGQERDAWIARSKLVISLHNHKAELFEVVRAHYLLSNAVPVVAEINPTTWIPDVYRDAVRGTHISTLPEVCVQLVEDAAARRRLAEHGYTLISGFPQHRLLQPLVGRGDAPWTKLG